jgi:hypothetical protein
MSQTLAGAIAAALPEIHPRYDRWSDLRPMFMVSNGAAHIMDPNDFSERRQLGCELRALLRPLRALESYAGELEEALLGAGLRAPDLRELLQDDPGDRE